MVDVVDEVAATEVEEVEEETLSKKEVEEHTTMTSTFSQANVPRII